MENKQVAGTLLAGILALVGVVIGANLTWMHIRSASGYEADSGVCDALSETGCSIALSESGMLLGMPISLIGVGGALAIVFCIAMSFFWPVRAAEDNRFLSLAWALGFVSVLASAGMAVVSFMDGRFCPLCVGWYFSNLGIFLATWWALRGSFFARVQSSLQSTFSVAGVGLTFGFTAFLMGGSLWMEGAVADGQEQRAELLKAQRELIQNELATREPQVVPELAHLPLKVGGNEEGPLIRIVEISDIECPFCKRLWKNLDTFMEQTDVRVEIQFLHYPLDSECNPRVKTRLHKSACHAALAAICAQEQEKFWEFTAQAFENQRDLEPEDLNRVAEQTGLDMRAFSSCLEEPGTQERLQADIEEAIRLGVKGTPTMIVNGYLLSGALSPEGFQLIADVAAIPKASK